MLQMQQKSIPTTGHIDLQYLVFVLDYVLVLAFCAAGCNTTAAKPAFSTLTVAKIFLSHDKINQPWNISMDIKDQFDFSNSAANAKV